jgi:hypothetical protein
MSTNDLSMRDADVSNEGDWGKAHSTTATEPPVQFTIFISCSALVRETKLCVGPNLQSALDAVYAALQAKEIGTESAVKYAGMPCLARHGPAGSSRNTHNAPCSPSAADRAL